MGGIEKAGQQKEQDRQGYFLRIRDAVEPVVVKQRGTVMVGGEEQGMQDFLLWFKDRIHIHSLYAVLAEFADGLIKIQCSCCIPEVGQKQQ